MDIEKLMLTSHQMIQLRELGFSPDQFTFMYYHCNGEWIWCVAETFLSTIRHDDILPTLTLQEILELIPESAELPNKLTLNFQLSFVKSDGESMLNCAFDALVFCVAHGAIKSNIKLQTN